MNYQTHSIHTQPYHPQSIGVSHNSSFVSNPASSQIEKATKDDLFFIAQKYEKKIRDALIKAFNQLRNQNSIDRVAEVLQREGISGVQSLFANTSNLIEVAIIPELTQAVLDSGRAMLGFLPKGSFLEGFNFSILDPNTSSQLRFHNSRLVQQISVNTQRAITQRVNAGVIGGVNPRQTARDLRGIVGLTEYQEQAVRNLEKGLRELDPRVLKRELIDGRQTKTIQRAIDTASPLEEEQIKKIVKRYRERMIDFRTRAIARTESLRATAMGEQFSLEQAYRQGKINREVKRFWVATNDGRTRNSHVLAPGMNSEGRAINEPFQTVLGLLMHPRDPNGKAANTINCLHPSTHVSMSDPRLITRRYYEGVCFTIKTSNGLELTCTPNHPILTKRGWVPIKLLKKGMQVIGTDFNIQRAILTESDINYRNISIEDVFNSFESLSMVVGEKGIDLYFHGEGIIDEQIDIVFPQGKLRDCCMSFGNHTFHNFFLPHPDFAEGLFFSFCLLYQDRFGLFTTSDSFVSFFSKAASFFFRSVGHSLKHGFTSIPWFNVQSFKTLPNDVSRFIDFFGNSFDRKTTIEHILYNFNVLFPSFFTSNGLSFPIGSVDTCFFNDAVDTSMRGKIQFNSNRIKGSSFKVFSDDIVSVNHNYYSGHVYNVDDNKLYYNANGILVHNCRCRLQYKLGKKTSPKPQFLGEKKK